MLGGRYHCGRKEEGKLAFKKKMTYTRSQSRACLVAMWMICMTSHARTAYGKWIIRCLWKLPENEKAKVKHFQRSVVKKVESIATEQNEIEK